jgi:hypothetical protein
VKIETKCGKQTFGGRANPFACVVLPTIHFVCASPKVPLEKSNFDSCCVIEILIKFSFSLPF